MPYKDGQARRLGTKERVRRHRALQKGVTDPSDVTSGVTSPDGVTDPWDAVKTYISRPTVGMPNLERIQRIAGSLGKLSDHVWFGVGGLSVGDIGRVIGTLPGKVGK